MIPSRKYTQIYQELLILAEWLEKYGVSIKKRKKFIKTISILSELANAQEKNQLYQTIKKYPHPVLQMALVNSAELIDIYLSCCDIEIGEEIKTKIRKAIDGPYFDIDENASDGSNEFRNVLFEFRLASRLRKAGIEAQPAEDINLLLNSSEYNIQCKRPISSNAVSHRFQEAQDQIKEIKKQNKKIFGIIAFSIDKVSNIEGELLNAENEESVSKASLELIDNFTKTHYPQFKSHFESVTVAVIVCVTYLAIIKSSGLMTTVFFNELWMPAHVTDAKNRHTRNVTDIARALKKTADFKTDESRQI